MIGSHFIKYWARTQNHVTLSPAEAELVALVKCSAELLGAKSMMRDFGVERVELVMRINSGTSVLVVSGSGSGRIPNS